MLKENLKQVEENICRACETAGRSREEVTLIAVSKTKPVEMLKEVYDQGIRVFGENKVQEMMEKQEMLPADIQWHMIGHLQRNKVKYLIGKTALIHSVDSMRLAEEINRLSEKNNVITKILVEVNIACEETKFGASRDEAIKLVEDISRLSSLRVEGLMTIAPYVENAEDNRQYFKEIKKLSVDIKQKNIDNVSMSILSMGMTGDYMVAIEEGATMVRVGTGIFGARNYSI